MRVATGSELVERARSAIGHRCVYKIGQGGFWPERPWPWDGEKECDCSGFLAWCLGESRKTDHPWYRAVNGGWLETSAILRDAMSTSGSFTRIPWAQAKPGALFVYGDRISPGGVRHHGHVGIISGFDSLGPSKVIHCSSGNFKSRGDAIMETPAKLFYDAGVVARVDWLDYS